VPNLGGELEYDPLSAAANADSVGTLGTGPFEVSSSAGVCVPECWLLPN